MKFSNYQRAVNPNTINAQVRPVTDENAYGSGGKEWNALGAAIGQINKVAIKQRDDQDAADVMDARNKIMSSLTQNLYGEEGLFTTGVGENARGLTDRTTSLIRQTFEDTAKNYNGRVQYALKGNLSENINNFQRIAAMQEQREHNELLKNNFTNAVTQNNQLAALNYNVDGFATNMIQDNERLMAAYAKTNGWSGSMLQSERRKMITGLIGGAAQAAIAADDMDRADSMLTFWRKDMDQSTWNQLYATVRKRKDSMNTDKSVQDIIAKFTKADGTFDAAGAEKEAQRLYGLDAKRWVSGGGDVQKSNPQLWGIAQETAGILRRHGIEANPDFLYGQMMHESSRGTFSESVKNHNWAGLWGGASGKAYADDHEYAQDYANFYIKNPAYAKAVQAPTAEEFVNGIYDNGQGWMQDTDLASYTKDVDYFGNEGKTAATPDIGSVMTRNSDGVNLDQLTDLTKTKLAMLSQWTYDKYGFYLNATEGYADGTGHSQGSWHYSGQAVDVAQDELEDADTRHAVIAKAKELGLVPLDEYETKSENWTGGHVHFSDHGDALPAGTGGSGGGHWVSGYDKGKLDYVLQKIKAHQTDIDRTKAEQQKNLLDSLQQKIVDAGSAEAATSVVEEYKSQLPADSYIKLRNLKDSYYEVKKSGGGTGGSGGSGGSGNGSGSSGDGLSRGDRGWVNELNLKKTLAYQAMMNGRAYDDSVDDNNFEEYRQSLYKFMGSSAADADDIEWANNELEQLNNDYQKYMPES